MKVARVASLGQVLSLVAGIAFCCLLFSYGITQDVPVGELEGTVTLAESGKPLADAQVYLSVPNDDEARERIDTTDEKGHYHFHNVKTGDYAINIFASEHTSKLHAITVNEGKPTVVNVALAPNAPYLKIYSSQRVWMPTETPQVEVHGFRNGDSLDVDVQSVAIEKMLRGSHFSDLITALRNSTGSEIPSGLNGYLSKVASFRHTITHKDAEGAYVEPLDLPDLPKGFYWIRSKGTAGTVATYISVSDIALVTKTAKGHVLGYVTDLSSGKPIEGATLWTQRGVAGDRAITDGNGLAETSYASSPSNEDSRAAILATKGPATAVVGVYTTEDAENSGSASFVIYTDRPVYRPGDEVQFKGIVRQRAGEMYLPPRSGVVDIELHDTDDQPFQKFTLPVSAHGSFSGHFLTSKEAGPGLYRIVAKGFGGRGSHFVHMMAYRKPEYNIQITPSKPYYVFGERASATIQCSYYYGGPVPGAKLNVSIYSSAASPINADDQDEASSDDGPAYEGGEFSKQIKLTTDGNGKAVVSFDTKTDPSQHTPRTDLDYSVNVSMTDASKKYVEAAGSILVTRGTFNLSAESQNFMVSPGKSVDVLVQARSNGAGNPPVPNQAVTVTAFQEIWDKDHKTSRKKILDTYAVQTDSAGKAHALVKASVKGTIQVAAVAKDPSGNSIESDDSFFVYGGRWDASADRSSIDVSLDKRRYKVGDVANVMLTTVAPGGSALVTVQTDHVVWKKVIPLPNKTEVFSLPIDAAYAPNSFVSVAYVHRKTFYENNTRLAVAAPSRSLTMTVTSDKPKYSPGDNVRLTVHAADAKGAPAQADVSLGVVDESIYAIRADDFNVLESFYPRKQNSVVTSYSFADVYLDGGDKGGDNVKIRRKFMDTAAWFPSVETDSSGQATVDLKLPDNLTEWRATAVAVTDETSVAKAITKFKARKELMVRLEMPEFLVQQDTHQLTTIVTNDGDKDRDVHFSLQAAGVSVQGETRQTVHLSAGSQQALNFQLGTGNAGQATLTAKAWTDGGPSDGVEQTFPIVPHGVPIQDAWSAEITDAKVFNFDLNPNVDRTTGRLKINVDGTMAGGLIGALDDLVGFPYGCVEQTMSRFMPSILVAKAVRDLGLPNQKLENQIPRIASDSMIRLARMQHEDGGWGWWENDTSDPLMTALVLDGLARCKRAGYPIRKIDTEKALDWSAKRFKSKEWKNDDLKAQCYLIYAMAHYGRTKEAVNAYHSLVLHKASDSEFATLAMAMNDLGPKFAPTRDRYMDRLAADIQKGPLGAYWENSESEWGAEGTALGLTAFMEMRPNDPIVPLVARYLMLSRKGTMWDSTRDTSYSLIGLTAYLAKTHELSGAGDIRVLVNGRLVRSVHFDNAKPNDIDSPLLIPLSDLRSGGNTVRIEKSGTGICYASCELKGTEIRQKIEASTPAPGLRVSRKYFRMESRRLENGDMQLLPSSKPVEEVDSGDIIRVELTVESNKARQFILIEDPTPSNCRVTEREELDEGEEWSFWWDRLVIRDDRVAFFIQNLPQGKQTITYTMKAEGLGIAHVLPTSLSNMYDLATRATGSEGLLEVK